MSWSFTINRVSVEDVDDAADELLQEAQYVNADEDTKHQIDSVLAMVKELVGVERVVGDQAFSASVSGHNNPDYDKREGWANPQVSINIFYMDREEEGQ